MGGGKDYMVKQKKSRLFLRIGIRHVFLLIFYLIMAVVLNEIVILGNDYIAEATDLVLSGERLRIESFLVPLLWMTAAGMLVAYLKSFSGNQYSAVVQRDARNAISKHLIVLPFSYFDANGSGSIMTRLSADMDETGRFFSEILPEFLVNLITVVTVTVYLIQMDPMLIIILFACYPVMLVVSDKLSKKLAQIVKRFRRMTDDRTQIAYDAIQGISVGRSFRLFDTMKRRIDTVIDDIAEDRCKSTKVSTMGWMSNMILTQIPLVVCYLFALYELLQNRITTGDLLAYTVLVGRMIYPVGAVMFCLNDFRQAGVSFRRLEELQSIPAETSGWEKVDIVNTSAPAICFKQLYFSYQEGTEVLKGVDFIVEQGETVAFVGGSGEGKSTIFRILLAFYQRSKGEYLLFGKGSEEWDLQALRDCFSYVSQNVFLLPQSIFQNVACGKEGATKEEVIQACKAANIHDFIKKLPEGYDTLVGERGTKLSGGERQRISIARAFLKDAPIILMDEPTAAVDAGTEAEIQEAIHRVTQGRTVLIVAHRLSTVKEADVIYVLHDGVAAEQGTHQELLKRQGIYAGLYGKEMQTDGA